MQLRALNSNVNLGGGNPSKRNKNVNFGSLPCEVHPPGLRFLDENRTDVCTRFYNKVDWLGSQIQKLCGGNRTLTLKLMERSSEKSSLKPLQAGSRIDPSRTAIGVFLAGAKPEESQKAFNVYIPFESFDSGKVLDWAKELIER